MTFSLQRISGLVCSLVNTIQENTSLYCKFLGQKIITGANLLQTQQQKKKKTKKKNLSGSVGGEKQTAQSKMAATMDNVEEIRNRVILEEFGVKNVSPLVTVVM